MNWEELNYLYTLLVKLQEKNCSREDIDNIVKVKRIVYGNIQAINESQKIK